MHNPYQDILKHGPDFLVEYRFYTEEEGGRKSMPFQGYRSDFWYEYREDQPQNELFMIWPEFLDDSGNLLPDEQPVAITGIAQMWIINPSYRPFHSDKIKEGLLAYLMEGNRKIASCKVIKILDLFMNPIK